MSGPFYLISESTVYLISESIDLSIIDQDVIKLLRNFIRGHATRGGMTVHIFFAVQFID